MRIRVRGLHRSGHGGDFGSSSVGGSLNKRYSAYISDLELEAFISFPNQSNSFLNPRRVSTQVSMIAPAQIPKARPQVPD